MKNLIIKFKTVTFTTMAILVVTIFYPSQAQAKWHSRADNLPGITTGELVMYIVVIAGGIWLISQISNYDKSNNKKNKIKKVPADSTQSCLGKNFHLVQSENNLSKTKAGYHRSVSVLPTLSLALEQENKFVFSPAITNRNAYKVKAGFAILF